MSNSKQIFVTKQEIPDNFIHFHFLKVTIKATIPKEKDILYFDIHDEDREKKVHIHHINAETGEDTKLATYYTYFTYSEGLYELLQRDKLEANMQNYRIVLKHYPIEDERFHIDINLYLRKDYLNELYEMDKLPAMIWKILRTESLTIEGRYRFKPGSANKTYKVEPELNPVTTIYAEEINGDSAGSEDKLLRDPYPYQAANIKWMCDLENKIATGLGTYQTCLTNTVPNLDGKLVRTETHVRFDVPAINSYLLCDKEGNLLKQEQLPQAKVHLSGGVLADQIGLGKTLSMIGLIYSQKKKAERLGKNLGPTLVLCPRRLCKQWEDEINKTAPLKSYITSTIVQLRKLTYGKLKDLDVVICPYSMFVNANYESHCKKLHEYAEGQGIGVLSDDGVINGEWVMPDTVVSLPLYPWHRLVLDEGHEYLHASNKTKVIDTAREIRKLHSTYRWICSGTPFATWGDLWTILQYVTDVEFAPETKDKIITEISGYYGYYNNIEEKLTLKHFFHMYDILMKDVFRYNNHDSVKDQIMIPPPNIETKFLDMKAIERNMYDSALGDTAKMFELCNHIMVSEDHVNILGNKPLPLGEIHAKMTGYYRKKIERLTKRIENVGKLLEEMEQADEHGEQAEELLHETGMKFEDLEEELATTKAKLGIFEALDEKLKEMDHCPICLEDVEDCIKVVLACGHLFCGSCITHLFAGGKTIKCPMCRQNVEKNEIETIKDEKTDEVDECSNEEQEIDKWGTKMSYMIKTVRDILKQNGTNRIILFSQWDTLLRLVHNILDEVAVPHLILNGSVYQVNSKIRKFKLDPSIRVVLLSSEKAASGLNLTEASHIILLDTLNNAAESGRLLEEQAIGRAVRIGQKQSVQVKRLVMRNTIEEEYFLKNTAQVSH